MQKALCTKTPLSRGVTGETFTDTGKKNKEKRENKQMKRIFRVKSKASPSSAVNGMQFPEEPAFFDFNELECRLLALRLAFKKLMQAPRGEQVKVHGSNVQQNFAGCTMAFN